MINDRISDDGFIYDEVTNKPILKAYDIILHHTTFLTNENVNDHNISLNPDLIQIVSHKTHNYIHNKLGYKRREVFLIYGSPCSGKNTYVDTVMEPGDLLIDIDKIWECVSGCGEYIKPRSLNPIVFGIRDYLMESVRLRRGNWNKAYILSASPLISERERICKRYGARPIHIDTSKEECIARLNNCNDGRNKEQWREYIERYFERETI